MILVGGENLIDFIQSDANTPTPSYQANVGGGPYNCAKALGQQGTDVGYITPISTDSLGGLLMETLQEANVRILSDRRAEPTSLAVVSLQNGAPRYQFYRENTAERNVSMASLMQATPSGARALCVGSLALTSGDDADIWAQYYCLIHNRGVFTALDPNIRAAFIYDRTEYLARLDKVLNATDLFKLSDEDLEWLIPDTSLEDAARQLMARSSAKLMVVTLGKAGAFALIGGRKVSVPAANVRDLQDTVGAGDTFMATLLARLDQTNALQAETIANLDDTAVEDLLRWAGHAAALNCEKAGCSPPTRAELENRRGK